ncbi:MAG: maleylpyruvate isomerase family mycothiol-dependent enzyme [Chloroflexi bacterium]|nr:maleylpyruvate isomerase family mycothiol-dependent enzyme [Chloroflexota bacterium]
MMDLTAIRAAIADLDRAFQADMAGLPAATWQQPSDCEGWTIAAALIHCAQVAELLGDSIARGRTGDPGPPPLAAAEGVAAFRAARAARQQEALKQSPAELLDWYRQASAAIAAELDAIPSTPAGAQGWHPIGAQPLVWVQDQWLFELALHDWDIRVALDPAAEVRTATQAAFARTLPARFGRGFGGADDAALAGVYRVELQAGDPLTVTFQIGNGAVAAVGNDATPDVTIVTDPSAFGLVMSNRRPVERFASGGRWQVRGDAARADAFARAFKSY